MVEPVQIGTRLWAYEPWAGYDRQWSAFHVTAVESKHFVVKADAGETRRVFKKALTQVGGDPEYDRIQFYTDAGRLDAQWLELNTFSIQGAVNRSEDVPTLRQIATILGVKVKEPPALDGGTQ